MLPETCDTAEVDRWIKRSKQMIESNSDSVSYYLNKALLQSYNCQFNDRILIALADLSAWAFGRNLDQAIHYAHQAIAEYQHRRNSIRRKGGVYKAYNVLARIYETKGMIDSTAYYYYLLNDELENGTITDAGFAVSVYSQLALFWINSNWDINGGYVEPARHFIEKAVAAEGRLQPGTENAYTSYTLYGAYYYCIKQYDSARYYWLNFLHLRDSVHQSNATWQCAMYLNTAESYLEENRAEKAIPYIEKALTLKEKLSVYPRYMLLAHLYQCKALLLQKKYTDCIRTFEMAMNDASSADFLSREVIEAYKAAGDASEAIGNWNKAVLYKNTYIQLHDSLMKKDKLDMMNRLQIKYRMAEKDKELAEQKLINAQAESQVRKRNFIIGGISMIMAFLLVLFALWRRNLKHKQHLQQKEINSLQQKMEIAGLQATIEGAEKERTRIARELHDGIGGLLSAAKMNFETIKTTYQLQNKPDFIDGLHLLSEAASELRKTAHNMMPEMLLQDGLVDAVAYFCQAVARNTPTQLQFQAVGTITPFHPNFELTIYRIVQELVHNILKHAQATESLVQMGFSDQLFDLTIEDNGIGIPDNIMSKSSGMGLKSIEDRVRSINGKMTIRNLQGHGTGIYIEVPIQEENT